MHDVGTTAEAGQGAVQAPTSSEHPCLFSCLVEGAEGAMQDDTPAGNFSIYAALSSHVVADGIFSLPFLPLLCRQRAFGPIPEGMTQAVSKNRGVIVVNMDGARNTLVMKDSELKSTQIHFAISSVSLDCWCSSIGHQRVGAGL